MDRVFNMQLGIKEVIDCYGVWQVVWGSCSTGPGAQCHGETGRRAKHVASWACCSKKCKSSRISPADLQATLSLNWKEGFKKNRYQGHFQTPLLGHFQTPRFRVTSKHLLRVTSKHTFRVLGAGTRELGVWWWGLGTPLTPFKGHFQTQTHLGFWGLGQRNLGFRGGAWGLPQHHSRLTSKHTFRVLGLGQGNLGFRGGAWGLP